MIGSLKITTALIKRKRPDFQFAVHNDTPVTQLSKSLHKCRLALITTGGLYLKTDLPFNLNLTDGDSSFRTLSSDIMIKDLSISHNWYNHKFIKADLNCVFPIDRMREYVKKGLIGSLSEEHYSFMGHVYDTKTLMKNAGKVGKRLKGMGVDIAFLTPT
jgi:D-proline reductase (dithiol) PrdB